MKRILYISILFLLKTATVFAQREAENWFFGSYAAMEFQNGGAPVSFQNSAMFAVEGCASISDKNGQLLFYTNGLTVWNRFHQVMANGTDLFGFNSSTQGALIVPKPGSTTLYYLFSNAANELLNPGLYYSIVDISKDSVLAKTKNTKIYGSNTIKVTEKLTAVNHFNNRDIWVIATGFYYGASPGQEMAAFKITPAGISVNPVNTPLSALAAVPVNLFSYFLGNYLKASPDGNLLAGTFNKEFYLFNFDNKSGVVSNPQLLAVLQGARPFMYGTEFSPDSRKLYRTDSASIKQYDLSAGNLAAIIASETTLPVPNVFTPQNYAMQLAPDSKIYAIANDSIYVINKPNLKGTACDFTSGPKLVPPTFALTGLPNFIQSYFAPPKFTFIGTCLNSQTQFTITNTSNIDSVRWDFGEPATGRLNTSTSLSPSHFYNYSGPHEVTLKIYTQGYEVIQTRTVTIRATVEPNLGGDQELCEGEQAFLRAGTPGAFNETYLWNTGETTAFIIAKSEGIYWLELDNDGCISRDSVRISYKPNPKVELGSAKSFCGNATYTLNATYTDHPGATYLWKPGNATTPTITVNKTGMYSVVVSLNGCTASDSVQITILEDTKFSLGEDIVVCEGEKVYLQAPLTNPPSTYRWNTDVGNRYIIQPDTTSWYWVELTRGGCVSRDSIHVTFKACPPPPVPIIPNLISPDNDGFNDQFIIKDIPVGAWNLKILNRWGQLLLDKKGYENDWPKEKLTDGTYYYFLEDPDTGRTWKGWVEVVR